MSSAPSAPAEKPAGPAHRFSDWLRLRLTDGQRFLFLCTLAGVVCGAVAVLFHLAINAIWFRLVDWSQGTMLEGPWGLVLLALAPAIGGLATGIVLTRYAPYAAGSGIPQTKAAYYRDFGVIRLREGVMRFLLGTISVGMGNSLGREGPTVHICAAVSSKIGQLFGLAKKRVQAMVPVGMGAGIAAAFNTPISAFFFVFEELLNDFSSKALFGLMVAVVVAAVVERSILGEHPAFTVESISFHLDFWMVLAIPLGILSGLFGHWFVGLLLHFRSRFRRQKVIPAWLRPAIGGLGVGLLGVSVLALTGRLGVFHIGYADLSAALNGRLGELTGEVANGAPLAGSVPLYALGVLGLLFAGKFLATAFCYGSGASGGLFAPSLFIGGMLGAFIGVLGQWVFGYGNDVVGAMALIGMGSFFAAVIRAPLTSIMIIFEMTLNYTLVLPLIAANIIAYMLASRWRAVPVYDALLLQDEISLKKMPTYRGSQDWRNLPVSTIMSFDVVSLREDAPLAETLEGLKDCRHHAYPVLDAEEKIAGCLTHDCLTRCQSGANGEVRTVRDALPERKLVTVGPDTSIRDVANTLVLEDIDQVPVVSRKEPGKLLGFVTLHDIARQQNAIEDTIGR